MILHTRRTVARVMLAALMTLGSPFASAWDGVQTMVPGVIDATDGGSLGFRVWGPSCGGSASFAYLQSTDSNYNVYVALVLMAKAQGLQVTFYTNRDSSGYCHVGYITQN